MYRAKSGQVEITKDSAGMFHFSTSQALPTVKASDIEGGVDGAPDEMLLSMNDVV